MKPGRLYTKIFISFMLVLLITEVLVFGLFIFTAGRIFKEHFQTMTLAKVRVAKAYIEERVARAAVLPQKREELLLDAVQFLAKTYGARVWLSDAHGKVLAASFSGPPPATDSSQSREECSLDAGVVVRFRGVGALRYYVQIPISNAVEQGAILHALFSTQEPQHGRMAFGVGLLIIGVVIALLIVPVSRQITKPVNRLRDSALTIAGGDLDHRVQPKGKDEISQLGRAFNLMADKLGGMLRSSKELTANLSHELRSPLARMRVAEEILGQKLQQGQWEACPEYLQKIQEEIAELDQLIGRILELSKVDLEQGPLEPDLVDLGSLVREALDRFEPALAHKGLQVEADLQDAPLVAGQRDALLGALDNLLDNVVKFTPAQGKVWVGLSTVGQGARLVLRNTCSPLAEPELGRLFEPFYRARAEDEQGSGLGLAIVRRIMARHHGAVQASSQDGWFQIQIDLPGAKGEEV